MSVLIIFSAAHPWTYAKIRVGLTVLCGKPDKQLVKDWRTLSWFSDTDHSCICSLRYSENDVLVISYDEKVTAVVSYWQSQSGPIARALFKAWDET